NMVAWQLGLKWGDALGVPNLFLRTEYNLARPYIYSHREVLTNWSHYQQPLAHPWGANFRELLVQGNYRYQRWSLFAAYHYGEIGRNAEGENWGGDIFESWDTRTLTTGVFAVQGQTGKLSYLAAELAYTLNPNYNLEVHAGYRARTETTPKALARPDSRWFYFGLRTNVYTSYQDF
ncbi:MAG: gliding motility protein RemB, partial [Bacteroidetes bacterium]